MDLKKKQHFEELKELLKSKISKRINSKHIDILDEDYCEIKYKDWSEEDDYDDSKYVIIILCGYYWRFKIKRYYKGLLNVGGYEYHFTFEDHYISRNGINCCYLATIHEPNNYSTYIPVYSNENRFYYKAIKKSKFKKEFKKIFGNSNKEIAISFYMCRYFHDSTIKRELREEFEEIMQSKHISDNKKFHNNGFEWIIDWNYINNNKEIYSPPFKMHGYNWRIKLYPNGDTDRYKEYVSISLCNNECEEISSIELLANYSLYIRNYRDCSCFKAKYFERHFNKDFVQNGCHEFIKAKDLYTIDEKTNRSLIEDNKIIVGLYLNVYDKDHFMKQIKEKLDQEDLYNKNEILSEGFYEQEFDKTFELGNYHWKLSKKCDKSEYSLTLHNEDVQNNLSFNLLTACSFYIFDEEYNPHSLSDEQIIEFSENNPSYTSIYSKYYTNYNYEFKKSLEFSSNKKVGVYIRIYKNNNDQFINTLKSKIHRNDEIEIINENCYEWSINDWERMMENDRIAYSPEFTIGYNKWNICLQPNINDEELKEYISLYLNNITVSDNNFNDKLNVYADFIIYIRNKNLYNHYYYKKCPILFKFNEKENCYKFEQFIKKSDLSIFNHFLIENNETIIGVFITVYKPEKLDLFVNRLQQLVKYNPYEINENNEYNIEEGFFEKKIEKWSNNFNSVNTNKFEFVSGGYNWECLLHNNKSEYNEYLSMYIKCIDFEDKTNKNYDSDVQIKYVLYVRNYKSYSYIYTLASPSYICLNKDNMERGFSQFILKSELYIEEIKLLEDDNIIFGVYLCVKGKKNNKIENRVEVENRISPSNNNYEIGDLVVALYNFQRVHDYELDFKINEHLRVTDWNYKDGWAYGYKCGNPKEKGVLPKFFLQKCDDNNDNIITEITCPNINPITEYEPSAPSSYETVIKNEK